MPPLSISQITAEYKRAISFQIKGQNELALAIYSQILETKTKLSILKEELLNKVLTKKVMYKLLEYSLVSTLAISVYNLSLNKNCYY